MVVTAAPIEMAQNPVSNAEVQDVATEEADARRSLLRDDDVNDDGPPLRWASVLHVYAVAVAAAIVIGTVLAVAFAPPPPPSSPAPASSGQALVWVDVDLAADESLGGVRDVDDGLALLLLLQSPLVQVLGVSSGRSSHTGSVALAVTPVPAQISAPGCVVCVQFSGMHKSTR